MKTENEIILNDYRVKECDPIFEQNDIFKYSSIHNLEKTLDRNSLYFNSTDNYNDPFEMTFDYHVVLKNFTSEENKNAQLSKKSFAIARELKDKCNKFISQYKVKHNTNIRIAYARKSPINYEIEIASMGGMMTNGRHSCI